jgi:hypothetical protein
MKITAEDIERRLQLHILNLCLAATAGKQGDIRECKGMIVREVERIIHDATNPHVRPAARA